MADQDATPAVPVVGSWATVSGKEWPDEEQPVSSNRARTSGVRTAATLDALQPETSDDLLTEPGQSVSPAYSDQVL